MILDTMSLETLVGTRLRASYFEAITSTAMCYVLMFYAAMPYAVIFLRCYYR